MPTVAFRYFTNSIPIFIANKQFSKAKEMLQKATTIAKTMYPDSAHNAVLKNQRFALQIADAEANTSEILKNTEGWLSGMKRLIERQITFLPDGEKTQFLESLSADFAAVASVLSRNTDGTSRNSREEGKFLYDLALLQKGIALADTRSFQQKLSKLPEGNAKNAALQLAAKMKSLNNDNTAFDIRIQFSREADDLRTLLKNDTAAKMFFTNDWLQTSYADIQSKMKDDEIAIEFLDFKYQTPTLPTDSVRYYALALRKTGNPIPIFLFDEQTLIDTFASVKKYLKAQRDGSIEGGINTLYEKTLFGKKLTNLIWQPLENAKIENAEILRGVKTVFYAPTGLLHRIAFAALPNSDSAGYLSDRYHLVTMNSTRDIDTLPDEPLNWKTATTVFFDTVQYKADTFQLAAANKKVRSKSKSVRMRSVVFNDSEVCIIDPLEAETTPIIPLFQNHKDKPSLTVHKELGATEDAVRAYDDTSAPTIMHISTHGLYNQDATNRLTPQQSLHRNFLFMAGSERVYCQKKDALDGFEDGILTAAEIAQMNLSATQLVVLAACQTGLGDLKGREGVYGLSRGFKLAGVRYTLASLWSVPPQETSEYMTCFYTHLLDGKTIPEAYAETQKNMQKEYADSPHKWAAWVLTR
jgi:CHAT domain-containing protein